MAKSHLENRTSVASYDLDLHKTAHPIEINIKHRTFVHLHPKILKFFVVAVNFFPLI